MSQPTKRKVYAATIGAGAGLTVSEFALWCADQLWWPAEQDIVPPPVAAFVNLVVTVGLAFIGGWLAKEESEFREEYEVSPEAEVEFEHEQRLV